MGSAYLAATVQAMAEGSYNFHDKSVLKYDIKWDINWCTCTFILKKIITYESDIYYILL